MATAFELLGTIRSYNGSKGYGFIIGPAPYGDTMFSRTDLPEDAREVRGNVIENRQVSFDVALQPDGRYKATRVNLPYEPGQKCPGIIKSFSHKNGYGFAKCSCLPEDIRFQLSAFQPAQDFALDVDLSGALVLIEVERNDQGKLKASKIQFQTAHIASKFHSGAVAGFHGGAAASPFDESYGQAGKGGKGMFGKGKEQGGTIAQEMLQGTVKSFSDKHGYGFIAIPGLPLDVRFGREVVEARNGVATGTAVHALLMATPEGKLQAARVVANAKGSGKGKWSAFDETQYAPGYGNKRAIDWHAAPPAKQAKKEAAHSQADVTPTGQFHNGTVKSYSIQKGFGFISCPELETDAFFLMTALPQEVRDTNMTGKHVVFELCIMPDGKQRAQNVTLT